MKTNLRMLMDEIFGPENFIGQFVWAAGRKNDSRFLSESHEYIVVYSRKFEIMKREVGEWRSRKEGLDDDRGSKCVSRQNCRMSLAGSGC